MTPAPIWDYAALQAARVQAEEQFRTIRYTESPEVYTNLFDEYRGAVEQLMRLTDNLSQLNQRTPELLRHPLQREVLRYLTGPPVSEDDLKVLMGSSSMSVSRLTNDPSLVERVNAFVSDWLDRRRFPWLVTGRKPTIRQREAAIVATASIMAVRRLETLRRNEGKGYKRQR